MDNTTTTNNTQQQQQQQQQQPPPQSQTSSAATTLPATATPPRPPPTPTTGYPPQQQPPPYHHLLQQQQQQLQMFWSYQRQEIEQVNDFKNHQLPLARIKKIMKADEDVRMISAEAPILFAKACELFILELTIRSWLHAEENKRRTLQKSDIAAAITRTDIFDFLVDIVPREEIKDDGGGVGGMVGGMMVGPGAVVGSAAAAGAASGVPYYYPPMGQPAPMIGRPAVVDAAGMYVGAAAQGWQSVWQNGGGVGGGGDDGGYGTGGGNGGQSTLDGQSDTHWT